jgi:hypothetical protein
MPRGVYVRSAQARANMSAAAKARAAARGTATKVVGYGRKGHAFRNKAKYNASMEGQRHAKDPNLSKTPIRGPGGKIVRGAKGKVFFNQKQANLAIAKVRAAHTKAAAQAATHQHDTHMLKGGAGTQRVRAGGGGGRGIIARGGGTGPNKPAAPKMPTPGGSPRKGGGSGRIPKRRGGK